MSGEQVQGGKPTIYFFPGLGADPSIGKYHEIPGYDIQWIDWPQVIPETWPDFERALLEENRFEEGAVLAGISFGGMIAQRLAKHLRSRQVILISSLTGTRSLSPLLRLFKPLIRFVPSFLFNMRLMPRFFASWLFGVKRPDDIRFLYSMSRGRKPADFKRLNRLALAFEADCPEGIPVSSIHGSRDHMILARSEPRDVVIESGGHLISITHADQVNRAILDFIEGAQPPPA